MNKFSIVLFALTTVLFVSCSDDDEQTEIVENEANYYALSVGNSWTYNVYRYDGATMEYDEQNLTITNTIVETEIINGETYFSYEATSEGVDECQICLDDLGNKSVRDSLGFLVDDLGTIRFTTKNEEPYLLSSFDIGEVYGEYRPTITSVVSPEGDFVDLDNNTYYLIYEDGEIAAGKDANYYRDGEGLIVKQISTVSSPNPLYVLTLLESTILQD